MSARTNHPRSSNANGDVESQIGHLKNRIDPVPLLRGSRHVATQKTRGYRYFLTKMPVSASLAIGELNEHRVSLFPFSMLTISGPPIN